LEADLGTDASHTLAITYTIGSAVGSVHMCWLGGAEQSANAHDVAVNAASGTGNPKTLTLNNTGANGAVFGLAGCGNVVNYAITYGGAAGDDTEEVDAATTTTGASAVFVGNTSGDQTLSATATGTVNRQCLVGVAIDEAIAVANISGGFTLGAVTVAGNVVATDRNVSGAITTNPVTVDGDGDIMTRVLGAIVLDNVDVSASLELIAHISGGILLGPVTVAGVVEPARVISGNVQLGVVEVAGLILPTRVISGDILLGAVALAGNLATEDTRNISGAILLGAVEVSGGLVRSREISGNVQLGSVTGTGEDGVQVSLDGAIVLTRPTVPD
jgi:hypothetical protein